MDNIVQGYFDHSKEEIENTLLWSLTLTVVCVYAVHVNAL